MQTMNSTKALTQLGFVTARGLDNGQLGALMLSNQVPCYDYYFAQPCQNKVFTKTHSPYKLNLIFFPNFYLAIFEKCLDYILLSTPIPKKEKQCKYA